MSSVGLADNLDRRRMNSANELSVVGGHGWKEGFVTDYGLSKSGKESVGNNEVRRFGMILATLQTPRELCIGVLQ